MSLTRPSKSGAGMSPPHKVELLYAVSPDIFKPDPKVQVALIQLVKTEAMERFTQGESLAFRVSVTGLCTVEVIPAAEGPPLPRGGHVEFIVRRKDGENTASALVKHVDQFVLSESTYPDPVFKKRYEALIGLHGIKQYVLTSLCFLFSETFAQEWLQKHHPQAATEALFEEDPPYPAFVFDGPPGLGKSELARSIGDPLARALGCRVVSYSIGLQLRGTGLVGEISSNITKVFDFAKLRHAQLGTPVLMHIDEVDSIGDARDNNQSKHKEDTDGVNTLLQQIDLLRDTPGVALLFTTNRQRSLDDALKERTDAHWVTFPRPGFAARLQLLKRRLGTILPDKDLTTLAWATEGLSPRALGSLVRRARIEAASLKMPLTQWHLLRAAKLLTNANPSVRRGSRNGAPAYAKENSLSARREQAFHVNGHKALA
jgi:ATPase family associated with various cellular activities (AAA)